MEQTIYIMHITCAVCLALSLVCLIGLILFVLKEVIRPILLITECSKPLQEGRLAVDISYSSNNELGGGLHVLAGASGQVVQGGVHLLHSAGLLGSALGQGLGAAGELLGVAGDPLLRLGDAGHCAGARGPARRARASPWWRTRCAAWPPSPTRRPRPRET